MTRRGYREKRDVRKHGGTRAAQRRARLLVGERDSSRLIPRRTTLRFFSTPNRDAFEALDGRANAGDVRGNIRVEKRILPTGAAPAGRSAKRSAYIRPPERYALDTRSHDSTDRVERSSANRFDTPDTRPHAKSARIRREDTRERAPIATRPLAGDARSDLPNLIT